MEKKLYKLKINESLEHVMPPLQVKELEGLKQLLLSEGCRDSLVVWKETGELVDGHNRYRICHENSIPFSYVEKSFASETEAKTWIINTQLGRRNVTDFVRCEQVLPLEDELKAEAKKRQGQRNDLDNILVNLPKSNFHTRDKLAEMAGVSSRNFDKAKKLIQSADEDTKEKLRNGEISIHGAYTALKKKPDIPKPKDSDELIPGHTTEDIVGREMMGYKRPPDSVYDEPSIVTYGMMPADDMECRERAEMAQATSDLRKEMEGHLKRVSEILRKMTTASRNEENIETLKKIIMKGNDQIMEWFGQMMEEESNEE